MNLLETEKSGHLNLQSTLIGTVVSFLFKMLRLNRIFLRLEWEFDYGRQYISFLWER